jgi:hypothetical protein
MNKSACRMILLHSLTIVREWYFGKMSLLRAISCKQSVGRGSGGIMNKSACRMMVGIPPWIATSDTGVRTVEHESPG